jgi:hypothetical protein
LHSSTRPKRRSADLQHGSSESIADECHPVRRIASGSFAPADRVRALLAKKAVECNDVIVLQNQDQIYWQLQETGKTEVNAVQIRPKQYCVFNATPLGEVRIVPSISE